MRLQLQRPALDTSCDALGEINNACSLEQQSPLLMAEQLYQRAALEDNGELFHARTMATSGLFQLKRFSTRLDTSVVQ